MNKTANYVLGGIAIIALLLSVMSYNKTPDRIVGAAGVNGSQGPTGPQGPAGRDGQNGRDGVTKVITQVVEKPAPVVLGSITGPDTQNDYRCDNNVCTYFRNATMNATGSTTCQLFTPSATTTLRTASAQYTTMASTSVTHTIGWAAGPMATTTTIGSVTLSSTDNMLVVIASSTASTFIVPPNTYIAVKNGGGGSATAGSCSATFQKL